MVCTTLTVQAPQPVVTISSIGFAKKNLLGGWDPVSSTCIEPADLIGRDIGLIVNGTVSNAKANFLIEASYVNPQVQSKVFNFNIAGQNIGTFSIGLVTTEKYEAGYYQALSARALNVTSG